MSDAYQIPEPVIDALVEDREIAEKAFRENAGVSVAALAEGSRIPAARLEEIERGATPTDAELEALSETLAVPKDLLVNE